MRIKEIRLRKLRELVEDLGGIAQVADASGLSQKYLSQILNGHPLPSGNPRNIGDVAAKRLEHGCGKPDGWMDDMAQQVSQQRVQTRALETLSPVEKEILMLYRKSSKRLKGVIINVCRLANEMPE